MRISDWSSDVCSSDLEDWQKDATRALATGRTGEAIHAYAEHGMVHAAETREAARAELIDTWDAQRLADPEKTRIILTHTNAEVRDLNQAARDRLREAGELGQDVRISAERGARERSEEHTSELQSLMRTSYAGFCLKKNIKQEPTREIL